MTHEEEDRHGAAHPARDQGQAVIAPGAVVPRARSRDDRADAGAGGHRRAPGEVATGEGDIEDAERKNDDGHDQHERGWRREEAPGRRATPYRTKTRRRSAAGRYGRRTTRRENRTA